MGKRLYVWKSNSVDPSESNQIKLDEITILLRRIDFRNVTLEGNPGIRNSQGGGIIGGGKAGSVILQRSATLSPFTVSTTEQRRIQFSASVHYCLYVTLSVRFIGSSSL